MMSRSARSPKNDLNDLNPIPVHDPDPPLVKPRQWDLIKKRYRMTKREMEIARLVCHGLSNEQIARDLRIKHGTVKTHVRNIYRKTWVNNKVAMLLKFLSEANYLDTLTSTADTSLPE